MKEKLIDRNSSEEKRRNVNKKRNVVGERGNAHEKRTKSISLLK